MADLERIYALATSNRLLAAEMFAGLTQQQWATASLCAGWTVREVAAHLIPPERLSVLRLAAQVVRYRGDLDRMVDETARRDARLPVEEIVRRLRERAGVQLTPPVTGASGPMADTAIHLRDAARPLGLDVNPEPPAWGPVLDFLVSPAAARGFIPRGRLAGLRLSALDLRWTWGAGAEVSGAAEALALAVAGRAVVLPELQGPGGDLLVERLATPPSSPR